MGKRVKAASMPAAKIGQPVCCCRVPVAADMVCVGVGIDDSFQIPALLIQDFPDFAPRVFVVSAVDQVNIGFLHPIDTDFGGAFDIKRIFADLMKLKHE